MSATPARYLLPLVLSTALLVSCARAPEAVAQPRLDVDEATIAELQDDLAAGRLTARQLTEHYLQRIADIDRAGPTLRSIVETNPDALSIAGALDEERTAAGPRGPLHGIPIVIKDNIETADRMATTAGSLALDGSIAQRDAFVVERLREAGAVILAKANLSEWANFRSTSASSGWSARGGQVKNPYALDRNPCGSSSGTATAVSANLAAAGVGTETDGSIVCPASATGLVGIKPTVGLVSRSGIIPISHTQDTPGPMARTVADAAALLAGMVGEDPRDPATQGSAARHADYQAALDANALKGARIGVARARYFGYSPEADALIEAAIGTLEAQGAEIVDPADIRTASQIYECELEVLLYEFKANLNAYLESLGPTARVKSLDDLIAFNERERAREMPYFGQELLLLAQDKGPLSEPAYTTALATCRARARDQGIDAVLREHRLDAIVAPTGSPAWPTDLINGDHFLGASSSPAAVAGYPSITVPAGYVHGLPVGISFIGGAWSEARLIGLAYAFEQATKHRRPPSFAPTVELEPTR